jgi:hypothetical protein
LKDPINAGEDLYFLGILDENEISWNSFLGARLGIPYGSLECYRAHSTVVRQFQIDDNISLTLRVYENRRPPALLAAKHYSSFDKYRLHSKIVERFTAGDRPLT